jgi:hypothetical protein
MKPFFVRMAAVAAAVVLSQTGNAAAPGPQPLNTIYDFYLGGVKAGELTIDARYQGDQYNAQSVLRTAGVVGMVYKASFEAEAQGLLTDGGMVPERFAAASRMKRKEQYVEMIYGDNAPRTINAEPAFIPKPWEIEPSEQTGTLDPISGALIGLAPVPKAEVCNKSVEIFDGRRRYAIDLGAPSMDNDRIKCPAKYRRIAGFKPKMMKKQAEFPFNVWFKEDAQGNAYFFRAAGESMFGVAVILLRE